MSNSIHVKQVGSLSNEKKSFLARYLQNPFSIAWSKLAELIKTKPSSQVEPQENYQTKPYKLDSEREQYFYTRFTDRVDPSIYSSIFLHNERW